MMNQQLRTDILTALIQNYDAVERGSYLQKVRCPRCDKREAFVNSDAPWMVKCGRENKCGDQFHVKELFPEFFETWTERYDVAPAPGARANPTAVADGYLRDGRGFDLAKIVGWYTQDKYYDHTIDAGTTTVRFALHGNTFWERLLDKPERFGKQKARIVGPYKGEVWMPPIFTLDDLAGQQEIWIVEGIFDAIALLHVGTAAVASISSSNYIGAFLERLAQACGNKRPTLVWAQDSDRAGRKAIKKFAALAEKSGWSCKAAQIPLTGKRRHDWNDLLQLGRLGSKDLERYRYHGDLLLAKSPTEKALRMYWHKERREFWFEYERSLYWWKLDMEAYDRQVKGLGLDDVEQLSEKQRAEALRAAGAVRCICTALPVPLYYQANQITDESWYYFRVELPDGRVKNDRFTGGHLASASEFKKRLLAISPGAMWTGSPQQLDRLLQDQIGGIKIVETIDYIGYTREHGAYVFNDLAFKDGKTVRLNDEDYFEFGRLSLKSLSNSPHLLLNTDITAYDGSWTGHLLAAFSTFGVVSLAFWVGSLFAEQIRARQSSFPFFELVGQAGAGKTTLIEFLWKLFGRDDWEGLDPQKMTVAALNRYFVQVSNLPVVLIEADRDGQDKLKQQRFSWEELKPAYNGRAMRSRGVKNNGNDTYEPPFRGAFVISQNDQVEASEAILSRICHITVTREHHSPASKNHSDWLARVPVEQVSGFLGLVLKQEQQLLALFDQSSAHYENYLLSLDEIRMVRIAKNHAQLLALVDCLGSGGLNLFADAVIQETRAFVVQMATARQAALNADHPLVAEFWEAFDYIESTKSEPVLNHLGYESREVAINLKEFERWCGELKLRPFDMRELKRYLRTSKARKFIESNRAVRSRIDMGGRTVKCWVFLRE